MSSFSLIPSSRLRREEATATLAAVDPTGSTNTGPLATTTTTIIPGPFPTSPSTGQPGVFFSGGASTPLLAGFISIGAFALGVISICAWCKFVGRRDTSPDVVLRRLVDGVFPGRRRRRDHLGQFGDEEEVEGGDGAGAGGEHVQRRRRRGRRRSRLQQGQGRGSRSGELSRARPEMFDTWIEREDNTLNWETAESVPLSATLFSTGSSSSPTGPPLAVETPSRAAAAAAAEVSSSRGGHGRESVYYHEEDDRDEEKRHRRPPVQMRETAEGSSTLQVAVLLQMPLPPPPSPPSPSNVVTEVQNDFGVRGELVIGLVEASWTGEHPSSREGEETATS